MSGYGIAERHLVVEGGAIAVLDNSAITETAWNFWKSSTTGRQLKYYRLKLRKMLQFRVVRSKHNPADVLLSLVRRYKG